MNPRSIIVGLITVIVVIGGVYFLMRGSKGIKLPKLPNQPSVQKVATSPVPAGDYKEMKGENHITVTIDSSAFKDAYIRVARGTVITWRNQDNQTYAVTVDSQPSQSFEVRAGEMYSMLF